MSRVVRHPQTNEVIQDRQSYDAAVQDIVAQQPPIEIEPIETGAKPAETLSPQAAALVARAEAMGRRAAAAAMAAEQKLESEPEDAHKSLGGGQLTFDELGYLPSGRTEDVQNMGTQYRNRQLVTRLRLHDRYIDVPVDEHGSHGNNLQAATERLVKGGGKRLPKPRRK